MPPELFIQHAQHTYEYINMFLAAKLMPFFSDRLCAFYYFNHRYQNCVYTYRILPNEDKKLSVQVG